MARLRPLAAFLLAAFLVACSGQTNAQPPAPEPDRRVPASPTEIRLSFAPVVQSVAPAVVSITSRKATVTQSPFADDPFFRFFFRDFPQLSTPRRQVETSLGSGVIVRSEGIIVTNHHVVDGADAIEVVLQDRRTLPATLLASDPDTDLAFLRVDPKGRSLPALVLGDSDAIQVGDIVLAIGNPFGIGQTVTSGIVSAKERAAPSIDRAVSFIQTDAAINPGNSGGALVTLDGKLIGINTAIFTRSGGSIGIGFAIPSNLVRARLPRVIAGLDFERPWLGTELQPLDADVAAGLGLDRPHGVVVSRVYPGSAADRAGVSPGDVILAIDGREIDGAGNLGYRLALRPPGEEAALTIWRDGDDRSLPVLLEPAPATPEPDRTRLTGAHPLAGATVANMSPAFNRETGLDMFETGVVVLAISDRSRASRLRLRPGDVIESIGGDPVATVDALEQALAQGGQGWRIGIRRNGRSTIVAVAG